MKATLTVLLALALAIGCGKDDKKGGDAQPAVDEEPTSLAIQTQADLPACDGKSEGQLVYVIGEKTFYTCSAAAWASIEIKGEKGDQGAAGAKGEQGADRFQQGLALYNEYRQSITRIQLDCACDGDTTQTYFGSGFICEENTICTNRHVVSCPNTGGCALSGLAAQTADASSDSVKPNGDEIAPFYSSTNPTLTLHASNDLAKISVPNVPSTAKIIPVSNTPLGQADDVTLMGILSMSYPLGMHDLYTDLGFINNNALDDCNTNACPGPYYDFGTANDTDKGSSGSPLIDIETGKVVGVTTAGTDGENANYTWAIDASYFGDF